MRLVGKPGSCGKLGPIEIAHLHGIVQFGIELLRVANASRSRSVESPYRDLIRQCDLACAASGAAEARLAPQGCVLQSFTRRDRPEPIRTHAGPSGLRSAHREASRAAFGPSRGTVVEEVPAESQRSAAVGPPPRHRAAGESRHRDRVRSSRKTYPDRMPSRSIGLAGIPAHDRAGSAPRKGRVRQFRAGPGTLHLVRLIDPSGRSPREQPGHGAKRRSKERN